MKKNLERRSFFSAFMVAGATERARGRDNAFSVPVGAGASYFPVGISAVGRFAKLALLTVVGVHAASVQASRWVAVGGGVTSSVYVDQQSLKRRGDRVKTWVKWEFSVPRLDNSMMPMKWYRGSKKLMLYDCRDRKGAIIQYVYYENADMSRVVDQASRTESDVYYASVVPDSTGEAILDFACRETAVIRRN